VNDMVIVNIMFMVLMMNGSVVFGSVRLKNIVLMSRGGSLWGSSLNVVWLRFVVSYDSCRLIGCVRLIVMLLVCMWLVRLC